MATMQSSAADADFYTMSEVDARLRQLRGQIREQQKDSGRKGSGSDDEDSKDSKDSKDKK